MNEQWTFGTEPYKAMIARHLPLWCWIENFIKDNSIKSIVDVGGGIGYAQHFVKPKDYTLYDQNVEMVKRALALKWRAYHGDFTSCSINKATKNADLVLITGVVEHAMVLAPFLKKALEVQPRFILVSFFKGFQPVDKILMVKNNCELRVYSEKAVRRAISSCNRELLEKCTLFSLQREHDKEYLPNTTFDGLLLMVCEDAAVVLRGVQSH